MDEKPTIPVIKCNPGSEFEFYAASVLVPNPGDEFVAQVRYFQLDEHGSAILIENPRFGSAYQYMHISDPF